MEVYIKLWMNGLMSECHKTKSLAKCAKTVIKTIIKTVIETKLKQKVREFAAFLTGVEGWFVLSYVECFEKAWIGRVVFVYNGLDFDAFSQKFFLEETHLFMTELRLFADLLF